MGYEEIELGDLGELLGIPSPWMAAKVEEDAEREHVRVHVRYDRGSLFHCPECGVVDQPVRDTRRKAGRIFAWAAIVFSSSRRFRA